MKKILKSTLLLLCGIGLFTACADDRDSNPTLQQPTTFVLNSPAYATSNIDLATSTGIPFTWNQPAYGFPVACTYQLQVSKDGNFTINLADKDEEHQAEADYAVIDDVFTEAKGTLGATKLSRAINAIFGWEEAPESATVYVRAKAELTGTQPVYSNVVTIKVIPNLVVAPSFEEFIYEIGNESGWKTAYPMRSPAQDGIYHSFNWLDGGFKFKPNADNWDGDWGQNPAGPYGTLVVDGEEDCNNPDPDKSFPEEAQPAGFYKIEVSLVDMTWKITPITHVSIIGGFNDWSGDVEMAWNAEEHCWEVTTNEVSGEFKFRANHDWAINWGGDTEAMTQDGANLSIEAGTYNFKFYPTYDGGSKVVITAQ